MVLKYDFLPPSDYLTKRWDQIAFTGAQFDASNGMGNCRMRLRIWYWDLQGNESDKPPRDILLDLYSPNNQFASVTAFLTWLNTLVADRIR